MRKHCSLCLAGIKTYQNQHSGWFLTCSRLEWLQAGSSQDPIPSAFPISIHFPIALNGNSSIWLRLISAVCSHRAVARFHPISLFKSLVKLVVSKSLNVVTIPGDDLIDQHVFLDEQLTTGGELEMTCQATLLWKRSRARLEPGGAAGALPPFRGRFYKGTVPWEIHIKAARVASSIADALKWAALGGTRGG